MLIEQLQMEPVVLIYHSFVFYGGHFLCILYKWNISQWCPNRDLMVCTFSWKGGQRAHILSVMYHWSVSLPGQIMTHMSTVMVTKQLGQVALEVIRLDMRVQLRELCSIIHLINMSRQLMNIHTFHLSDWRVRKRIQLVELEIPEDCIYLL